MSNIIICRKYFANQFIHNYFSVTIPQKMLDRFRPLGYRTIFIGQDSIIDEDGLAAKT